VDNIEFCDLHGLYYTPHITRAIVNEKDMGRGCSMNGEEMKFIGIFIGKPEGKRPLGYGDNIEMVLKITGLIRFRKQTSGAHL
jgi:hypothetical protein